jgi:hypothetical protein
MLGAEPAAAVLEGPGFIQDQQVLLSNMAQCASLHNAHAALCAQCSAHASRRTGAMGTCSSLNSSSGGGHLLCCAMTDT